MTNLGGELKIDKVNKKIFVGDNACNELFVYLVRIPRESFSEDGFLIRNRSGKFKKLANIEEFNQIFGENVQKPEYARMLNYLDVNQGLGFYGFFDEKGFNVSVHCRGNLLNKRYKDFATAVDDLKQEANETALTFAK